MDWQNVLNNINKKKLLTPAFDSNEALVSDDPQSQVASQGFTQLLNTAPVQQALDFGGNLDRYDSMLNNAVSGDEEARKELADRNLGMAMGSLKPMALAAKAEANAPTFYSKLQQLLNEKMGPSATPQQIEGVASAAKPEEIKYLKLKEFLQGKDKVNKEELLSYLKGNEPQLNDVIKQPSKNIKPYYTSKHGGKFYALDPNNEEKLLMEGFKTEDEAKVAAENAGYQLYNTKNTTKFDQYTLPGGENYKETLYTLPPKSKPLKELSAKPQLTAEQENRLNSLYSDLRGPKGLSAAESAEYNSLADIKEQSLALESADKPETYQSSHYDEPNILAHTRTNERIGPDGKKHLFAEEIQSDWHQAGRKQGYKSENPTLTPEEQKRLEQLLDPISLSPSEQQELDALVEKRKKLPNAVPDAPFKKTWQELALKKLLREAAEGGHDNLSWTTGAQQAERYDLSKKINEVKLTDLSGANGSGYELTAFDRDGNQVLTQRLDKPEQAEEYIGKDASKKLLESKEAENDYGLQQKSIQGTDLSVGGDGMKGFYDKIVPDFLNKFAKKFGGKVEQAEIPIGKVNSFGSILGDRAGSEKVHTLNITPEMREEILKKGFPLFTGAAMLNGASSDNNDRFSLLKKKLLGL